MLTAKDIMHPRVSLHAKDKGDDVVRKLMCSYPALPVVNDNLEVIGICSEYDVLSAIKERRTIHEFSAESIMTCGSRIGTEVCPPPVTVQQDTSIDKIVDIMHSTKFLVLPVVNGNKLVGIINRKNIINALAEQGFWPEHEFQKRTPQ